MNGFSQVTILGTIVSDVTLTFTAEKGTPLAKFSIVNNRKYAGKEESHYFDIQMWGDRAEAFAKYHERGSAAFIVGELKQDRWKDKDSGQNRSRIVIQAHTWAFLPSKGERKSAEPRHEPDRKTTPTNKKDWLEDTEPTFFEDADTPF